MAHLEIDQIAESRWQIRHIAADGTESIHPVGHVIGERTIQVVGVDGQLVDKVVPVYAVTDEEKALQAIRVDQLDNPEAPIWVAAVMFPGLGITGGRRWEAEA